MATTTTSNVDLAGSFKKGGVLDDGKNFLKTPPAKLMTISFANNTQIQPGEAIKVSAASTHPAAPKWDHMQDDGLYMLMMVDMDAPAKGKDKNKNYLHWLTVNMPYDDVARSNLVQKFTPPNPPKGTGKHRYVILAFQQGGKIEHKELQKHLKDGPAAFSLPQLLAVAAHAGARTYPTLEAGTYFTCEAGDVGVDLSKEPQAHKKTSSISIMTGDGKAVNLSPSSKPSSTPKSGVSPISPW